MSVLITGLIRQSAKEANRICFTVWDVHYRASHTVIFNLLSIILVKAFNRLFSSYYIFSLSGYTRLALKQFERSYHLHSQASVVCGDEG